jgi:hypothetical protein
MVPAVSDGASPTPPYSGYYYIYKHYQYRAFTFFGLPSQVTLVLFANDIVVLQPHIGRNQYGLGFSAFARHYLRNHYCFLFLRVLRCFSSPGSLPCGFPIFNRKGCPIRTSTDHIFSADPRGFSQLGTSFFASKSLGIPRTPLSNFLT